MQQLTCQPSNDFYKNCKNPIIYLLEEVKNIYEASSNFPSFSKTLEYVLSKGLVVNDCDFCCWKCANGYFLGSIAAYKLYIQEVLADNNVVAAVESESNSFIFENVIAEETECCLNIYTSVEEYLKYTEAVGTQFQSNNNLIYSIENYAGLQPCCNEFQPCLNLFFENAKKCSSHIIGNSTVTDSIIDKYLDEGIVELLPNGVESQICLMYDWLKEYTNDGCFAEIFFNIINNNFLYISCNENGTTMFSSFFND